MALGKYVRIDGHNSSRYCVTISIVVFVSTCFIGAWMAMSSAIGPLGLGLTLQQFMIGMPKKANLNNADVREETLKVNESNINVQASENVIPKEPQSSDLNVSIAPNTDKSFSWDEIGKKGSQEENSGTTNDVYTSNQDVPTDNSVNSSVQPQDSTSNQEVPTEKPAYNAAQPQDSDSNTAPNKTYPSNQEVPIEKPVDSAIQPQDSDSKTAPNETSPSNQEVPTEKPVDSAVQPQHTDSKTEPNEASTSNREVPAGTYVYTAGQPQDSDSKTGPNEVSDETNQVELTETKVNKTEGFPETIPSAWINAKNMQDRMANQTEKPSQDKSGNLSSGSTDIPSGLVSDDGKKTSNETSSQVARTMESQSKYRWKVCNVTTGPDYIPCLDNIQAIKKLSSTAHYEHRERHCPDEAPICLVPLPKGYKTPIKWPISRDMIWFSNVPHTKLVEYKGGQNWVKVYDRYLTFPGGGTQFKYGALHYIDYLEQSVPDIAWGKQSRVVLDVGCGVASFGGYLFERDVLAMSLAPKDEHEAQVQFALERGIPAISAVMGTKRLPFPSMVFDVIHCARCRVPWHIEGGKLLLELNRLLRPGGYFVWSATPVYRKDQVNVGIWIDTFELTKSICWELVKVERDSVNRKAAAIFRKPVTNDCYEGRPKNDPPFCEESDDSSRAWYTPLQSCIHKVPADPSDRGSQWPSHWPSRLNKAPYWLRVNEARGFTDDYNRWKHVITNTYLNGSGIDWSSVRNVMDMRASYGGFAAALKDSKVWVMNVVPVNSSDTLPIIYERGLFGIYHDWCESFSTYPRSYGLLHANQLFSDLKKRCSLVAVMAEVDRILRPGGWLIVRDDAKTVSEVEGMATSLHWNITFTNLKDNEQVSCVQKTMWRPSEVETISSAYG